MTSIVAQLVQVIGPALHHLATGGRMLGAVVSASVRVFDGIRKLVLNRIDALL